MCKVSDSKKLRNTLRQGILSKRRSITLEEAYASGLKIADRLKTHDFFSCKRVVGSYLSMGGELSTVPVNEYVMQNHILGLPFMDVHVKGHMDFYLYRKGDPLIENRFHILEPENISDNLLSPDKFEALIVPLVAFDQKGNRLGMGGGYYDRMLKKVSARCLIIGVAYDFQELENVPVEKWDMPLHEIITPTRHIVF
ncbi:MAG: 5-formyltetrahydrofolate cyclo-ligase [Succinivibrio sp.]